MKLAVCALLLCASSARGGTPAGVEMLPSEFDGKTPVVVETGAFRLEIGPDATARSLVVKATGEECISREASLPVFAATQKRPFNNETRLVQMAKRTTYPANRVRRDGDILRIGFDTAPYEAEVRVVEKAGYAAFELVRLISNTEQERQYYHWNMDVPPVEEFRLLQLPVLKRRNFGDWLNVEWDDRCAVAVLGGTPYMDVDHESRGRWRLMRADSPSGIGRGIITNGVAVLVAGAGKDALLGQIKAVEEDFDLPRGVESRRNPLLNASIYWTCDLSVANVDEHIAYMRKGGFRMMLLYSAGLFRNRKGYINYGDYDIDTERFPNGYDDLRAVLAKIKAAGVTPGFHTLQTFIGFESRYVTPEADPRLNVKRYFALERPLSDAPGICDVYVAQNPVDSPMHPKCRILKFGTELMSYEGYSSTQPYRFTGVRRGHLGTTVKAHGRGDGGGVLDVCECQATSCCIDQKTSLQDEIADKIAKVFDCGMEFLYFDGSEDVDVPCNINISLSQYRVARRCGKMPLFTEGCAKTHFGWHLQSGANAFDIFPPEVFKEKIVEYPMAAARRLAKDFTRVDFGWWGLYAFKGCTDGGKGTIGTQPDMWEYGTSKAAAFDCPATMQMLLADIHANGRSEDLLETVRRWEDVRARNWLTAEQKEMLRDPGREFHLYLPQTPGGERRSSDYELVEWRQMDVAGGKWTDVRAFMFERRGRRVVAYWHVRDRARLVFAAPLDGVSSLDAAGMRYFETELSAEAVCAAFASATIAPSLQSAPWIGDGRPLPKGAEWYGDRPAPEFRTSFSLPPGKTTSTLRVAVAGYGDVHVNGRRLAASDVSSLWSPYDRTVYADEFLLGAREVKPWPETNEVTIVLGNGFYNLPPFKMWSHRVFRDDMSSGSPAFKMEIDGTPLSRWTWRETAVMRNCVYLGTRLDATRSPGEWRPAVEAKGPRGRIAPRKAPPVAPYGRLRGVSRWLKSGEVQVVDFGVNSTGRPEFKFRGAKRGDEVEVVYGERLNGDGSVNVLTQTAGQIKPHFKIRVKDKDGRERPGTPDELYGEGCPCPAAQRDVYVCSGSPAGESFSPPFAWHVCRYAEVRGPVRLLGDGDAEFVQLSSDVRDTPLAVSFAADDRRLGRIHEMCRRTFRANMMGVQSDCPGRERLGYGGDIAATCDAFCMNWDMREFYLKTLQDFADEAEEDGWLTETAPYVGIASCGFGGRAGPMSWAMVVPVVIDALLRHYGDERALAFYPVCARYVRLVDAKYPDGLLPTCIGDHEAIERAPDGVVATAHWHRFASLTAGFADRLGRKDDAAEFAAIAAKVKAAFAKAYVKGGVVANGTQSAQAIGLYLDLVPEGQREAAHARLVAAIEEKGSAPSTGIFSTQYMLRYLSENGRVDLARKVVLHNGCPGWLHMLDRGATTLWETWKESDDVYSNCHPMFGSVDEWILKYAAQ